MTTPGVAGDSAEALFEHAPCGFLTTRPDGAIVRVNETFLRWTGHDRDDVLGRRFADLLTGGGRIYHETHYAPLLALQGAVQEIALDIVRHDGTRLPALVNAAIERDTDGATAAIHVTVFDATQRREYERELVRATERARLLSRVVGELLEIRDVQGRIDSLLRELVPSFADRATFEAGDDGGVADAERELVLRLAVPGRVLGYLRLLREPGRAAFAPAELELARDLAERASLAIENARLYEHERDVAATLQASMLASRPPRDPRLEIAAWYQPADDGLHVGGDWHDAFRIGPGRFGLVVGDVVGRGLPAASAMGQLRSAIRALALAGLGAATLLERLDAFVVDGDDAMRMATAVHVDLDLARGRATIASAGHPPTLLLAPGAPPRLVWDGRSPPLGVFAGPVQRVETEVDVPPGSRLLLYTDGLVERRGELVDEGLERLVRAAARLVDAPLPEMVDSLIAELMAGETAGDDTCLLAVATGSLPGGQA